METDSILPTHNKFNMIPDQQLIDILTVYASGKREDIKNLPNELICSRNGDFWTTWSKVFDIRDNIQRRLSNKFLNLSGRETRVIEDMIELLRSRAMVTFNIE